MKELILEYLRTRDKKRIKTKKIEDYVLKKLGTYNYRKQGGYQEFASNIKTLVQAGTIRPVKAWERNGMSPSLYNGYQIISLEKELKPKIKKKLLTRYHPALNTSYYLNNPEAYATDKDYLSLLDTFLKENNNFKSAPMTVNERSFQIFRDEKFLTSRRGMQFLNRVAVTREDLNCYSTYEPFFYYRRPEKGEKEELNILIIENKDTFFSFKELVQEGINSWGGTSFTLFIYGEGKKIQHSFPFFCELEVCREKITNFYYFGDLDPEGISIWYGLQDKREEEFIPYNFFYRTLIEKYKDRAPKLKKRQRFNQQAVTEFVSFLSPEVEGEIRDLFSNQQYLPQEGLNYSLLKKLGD